MVRKDDENQRRVCIDTKSTDRLQKGRPFFHAEQHIGRVDRIDETKLARSSSVRGYRMLIRSYRDSFCLSNCKQGCLGQRENTTRDDLPTDRHLSPH